MSKSKTIVFTHGLFVNPKSWENWKTYFESNGYTCYNPANPHHEGNPSDLRENISTNLSNVGFEDVVMNVANFIDTLTEKPIVIGHSLGGLTVMKLIELGKAAAGISIDGAAPKNILPPFQTVKTMFPVINFLKGNSVFQTNKEWFHQAFCNTLTKAESNKVFEEIAVPESRNIPRHTLYKSFAKIDFTKPHQPLLFIGGEKDNIIPPALTKKIATSYKDNNSITNYKIFERRSHYICGQDGWQDVADYTLDWLKNI